jgi:hypothetical protein
MHYARASHLNGNTQHARAQKLALTAVRPNARASDAPWPVADNRASRPANRKVPPRNALINRSKQRQHIAAHKGAAIGFRNIITLAVKLMPSILRNQAHADQLRVNEGRKLGIDEQQHLKPLLMIGICLWAWGMNNTKKGKLSMRRCRCYGKHRICMGGTWGVMQAVQCPCLVLLLWYIVSVNGYGAYNRPYSPRINGDPA